MSNTQNLRHRRKIVTLTFKGRGRGTGGGCLRPGRDAGSKQDFRALHRDTMRERKMHRINDKRGPEKATTTFGRFSKWFDQNWKQQKPEWRKSIWPEGKVANPGRMG